ncbi:MAG: acetate--CoA ligase family protein, partial [Candidatus Micrarchaeota archaeon]
MNVFSNGPQQFHRAHNGAGGGGAAKILSESAMSAKLSVRESIKLLESFGIRVLGKVVNTAEQARKTAVDNWGEGPVVLKVATQSKGKSKEGLVRLNVSIEDIPSAAEELKHKAPDSEGIWVAPMVAPGLELVLGAKMTEYGVAVVIGAGGTRTEQMKDVVVCVNPTSKEEVLGKLRNLKLFPLLDGEQGLKKFNLTKVADTAINLSRLIRDNPGLEVDLNPARLHHDSQGSTVLSFLDCRVVPNEAIQTAPEPYMPQHEFNMLMSRGLNPESIVFVGASDKVFGMTKSGEMVQITKVVTVPGEVHDEAFHGATIIPDSQVATVVFKDKSTKELAVGSEVDVIDSVNRTLLLNLGKFNGEVHLVNPKGGVVLGKQTFTSVRDVPSNPDVAVLLVPAEASLEALEECGKKGIRFVVMENSGFKEAGNWELEAKLVEIIKRYKMLVVGPNGIGIYAPGSNLDLMFLDANKNERMKGGGGTSIVSQSGSLVSIQMEDEASLGAKLNCFLSVGNMSGGTFVEFLRYFGDDQSTKVIGIVAEGVPDGAEFMKHARAIT